MKSFSLQSNVVFRNFWLSSLFGDFFHVLPYKKFWQIAFLRFGYQKWSLRSGYETRIGRYTHDSWNAGWSLTMVHIRLFWEAFLTCTLKDRFLIETMKSNRSFKVHIQVCFFIKKQETLLIFLISCTKIFDCFPDFLVITLVW